jgi:hypothetical protein
LRKVSGQEGADELLAPSNARGRAVCQIGGREAATHPQVGGAPSRDLVEAELGQDVVGDSSGKGFAALTEEGRCGAAQDQKACRDPGSVRQHPEDLEEAWGMLHFVEDDQSLEVLKGQERLCETGPVPGVFQIESGHGIPFSRHQSRQGTLANLSRSDDRYDRELPEKCPYCGDAADSR